jgi:hypothetical protein
VGNMVPTLLVPNALAGGFLAAPGQTLGLRLPGRQSEVQEMIQGLR